MERRKFLKGAALAAGSAGVLPFLKYIPAAEASSRNAVLVVCVGSGPNSMDIHRVGSNRESYQISVNLYDRLVTHGRRELEDGTFAYDSTVLEPELAESWEFAEDGMSVDFKLRKDATFWDGKPVTAHDVKWSFDRAVGIGGFPTVQMRAGSLEKPEQFIVVDDHTFRIEFLRKSKLTMPDLAVPIPIIINSEVAKQHATDSDPWAAEYLHRTPAGGGAFKLGGWQSGEQVVYERFDDWKSGPLPEVRRVVIREVPSASTRRALVERGDVDVSLDLPPRDAADMAAAGRVRVASVPVENTVHGLGLNMNFEPFRDKRVRQAIAYAIPYQQIFEAAAYEQGLPLYGADSFDPSSIDWPQPFPYNTDYDKSRELLAEAGYADGFQVPLSMSLGLAQWMEPTCLLIQEGLNRIGIRTSIDKIPGANWRSRSLVEKELDLHLTHFGGWLNYPEYYFFWQYVHGHLFNSMNYKNEEIEALVDETLHMEVDHPDYEPKLKRMIEIAMDEVPMIPIWQPSLDVAMQQNIEGYEHWFHRQLDCRTLTKA
ncbi:MAG: ABC transporter substrate-binding protein [Ectothiorhodospiraceae bacterium]|nr:ABC transporter substrate-binding protein [Ectothiorhodospiraceae bacterium]